MYLRYLIFENELKTVRNVKFLGYVWKDKSENGVRKILTDNVIPLDRLLIETDAPFMYPNTRSAKLNSDLKEILTPRYKKANSLFIFVL